jgi:hypothetical protein
VPGIPHAGKQQCHRQEAGSHFAAATVSGRPPLSAGKACPPRTVAAPSALAFQRLEHREIFSPRLTPPGPPHTLACGDPWSPSITEGCTSATRWWYSLPDSIVAINCRQWQTCDMDKFEHLRSLEIKAWLLGLEHAHQRKDRKSEKRIRENLRRLGHRGGLRRPAQQEDINQATPRDM